MPNARYAMELDDSGGPSSTVGTTDADGRTQSLSVSGHVLKGETMKLTCRYPGGDRVSLSQLVP